MFLLTSSNCITDSSAGVCCQNAPAPPSKTMLLAFRLLNSDPIFASAVFMLPVSGKRSAQYESLQEETNFKATRLQLWREQQEVSFSFLHRTAVGVAELTKLYQSWNSSTILPLVFLTRLLGNTLLFINHKHQQHTDITVLKTHFDHTASAADILEDSPHSLWTHKSMQQGQ